MKTLVTLAIAAKVAVLLWVLTGQVALAASVGLATAAAIATDPRPVRAHIQRAVWATFITAILFLGWSGVNSIHRTVNLLLAGHLAIDWGVQTGVQLVERTVEPSFARLFVELGLVEPIAQAAWLGFVVIHGAVLCLYAALRLVGSGELPSVSFLPFSRPRLEGPEDFSQWRRLRAHFSSGGIRASLPQLVSAPVDASNAGPLLGLWMRISAAATELRGFSLGLLQGVVLGVAVFARTAVRASAETAVCVVLYVTWYLHAHPASDQSIAVQIGFGAIVHQALVYSRWQFIERLSEPFLVAVFGAKLTQLRVILGQGLAAMIRRIAAALVVVTGFLTGDSSAGATPMLPPAQQVEDEQGLNPSSPSSSEDC